MLNPESLALSDHLLFSRYSDTAGDRNEFYKRVHRGELIQVIRGVFMEAAIWNSFDRHARYRFGAVAVAARSENPLVFSHASAAAMWRLPRVGSWPQKHHVVSDVAAGGRSSSIVVRHTVGLPADTVVIDGVEVTSLARTVVDIAATHSFGEGVTAADAALRRTAFPHSEVPRTFLSRSALITELASVDAHHGSARAQRTIDFADGLADRPGESLSRVTMHLARITPPQLQVVLYGASGRRYIVDFWWPEFNVIGEFDGRFKYSDPGFMRGRTSHQVLLDEKFREDDLRATGRGFTRWDMPIAASPIALRDHLIRAGVR